ncbi:MAG: hypothetical protein ACHQ5A_05365 [Opitutales bacterium]
MAVAFLVMHTRLLSFLSDLERALAADDPAPLDGTWENSRSVNYHLGLARLNLGVRLPAEGKTEARGSILLQSYLLADGSPCLKAALAWTGSDRNLVRSVYARPDVDWTREARKVAADWMAGPPARTEAVPEQPALPAETVDVPIAAVG